MIWIFQLTCRKQRFRGASERIDLLITWRRLDVVSPCNAPQWGTRIRSHRLNSNQKWNLINSIYLQILLYMSTKSGLLDVNTFWPLTSWIKSSKSLIWSQLTDNPLLSSGRVLWIRSLSRASATPTRSEHHLSLRQVQHLPELRAAVSRLQSLSLFGGEMDFGTWWFHVNKKLLCVLLCLDAATF